MLTEFANQIPTAMDIGEKLWGKFSPDTLAQFTNASNTTFETAMGNALIIALLLFASVGLASASHGYKEAATHTSEHQ